MYVPLIYFAVFIRHSVIHVYIRFGFLGHIPFVLASPSNALRSLVGHSWLLCFWLCRTRSFYLFYSRPACLVSYSHDTLSHRWKWLFHFIHIQKRILYFSHPKQGMYGKNCTRKMVFFVVVVVVDAVELLVTPFFAYDWCIGYAGSTLFAVCTVDCRNPNQFHSSKWHNVAGSLSRLETPRCRRECLELGILERVRENYWGRYCCAERRAILWLEIQVQMH